MATIVETHSVGTKVPLLGEESILGTESGIEYSQAGGPVLLGS